MRITREAKIPEPMPSILVIRLEWDEAEALYDALWGRWTPFAGAFQAQLGKELGSHDR